VAQINVYTHVTFYRNVNVIFKTDDANLSLFYYLFIYLNLQEVKILWVKNKE